MALPLATSANNSLKLVSKDVWNELANKINRLVLATDYIAADGSDGRTALQTVITNLAAAGGGTIYFPPGTYTIGSGGTATGIDLGNNITLIGEGAGSVLKMANTSEANFITVTDHSNVAIRNLCVDGNRANNTVGTTIRVAGCTNLIIDGCLIRQAASYGIGFQAGTMKNVKMSNLTIEDTGADGIDFKNKNNANEDLQLNNISVRRWGLRADLPTQAGIDIRGPAMATNIWISEPGADDAVGYRFRQGETADVHGLGGHDASLTNFDIRMGAGTVRQGINIVAREVRVANGRVEGGFRGLSIQDSGFRGSQIHVHGASGDGFLLDSNDAPYDGEIGVLTACKATGCGGDGFDIEGDYNQLYGCYATGNTGYGYRIQASSDSTKIYGGYWLGNTAGTSLDSGTGTVVA